MAALRAAIYGTCEELQPITLRGLFYALVSRGVIEKTENQYKSLKVVTAAMRRSRELPFRWLTDSTRLRRKPDTWGSLKEALDQTARLYRRALWANQPEYVEIWCEKDTLSGVIYGVTEEWDVPLMVTRGNPSITFLYSAAQEIAEIGKPTTLYMLADYDPGGASIADQVERGIEEFAEGAIDFDFVRLAVTPEQITDLALPTRPTKRSDTRAAAFGDERSVEVDAIPPQVLRELVTGAIASHVDGDELTRIEAIEEAERGTLRMVAGRWDEIATRLAT